MRKSFWIILAALLMIIAAPRAQADTVTFTCTGESGGGPCLVAVPTAPDVAFPGPTLDIKWNSQEIALGLPIAWPDSDSYIWFASNNAFFIFNLSLTPEGTVSVVINTDGLSEGGKVIFGAGSVAAPEADTVTLLLIGIGLLGLIMVMRKRMVRGFPQVT